jgi:hypothetical protein
MLPVALFAAGCGGHQHQMKAEVALTETRSITVVGRGEASGKPDIARTSLGVEATAATVDEAMNRTSARMKAIMDALRKLGIEDKDMQTQSFSVSVERPYPPPPPMPIAEPPAPAPAPKATPKGAKGATAPAVPPPPPAAATLPAEPQPVYRVSNQIEVKIRDVSKAGKVLQAAVDAGANNVWGVNFQIEHPEPLEGEARTKAIADARARAEALAKLSGLKLGPVLSVSEEVGRGGPPMPMFASAEAKMAGEPPMALGEVTVGTSIEVVFGVEKEQPKTEE